VAVHPRRLGFISAAAGNTGGLAGLPPLLGALVATTGIRTNLGGGTEDEAYVIARQEVFVSSNAPKFRVAESVGSGTLTLRFSAWQYGRALPSSFVLAHSVNPCVSAPTVDTRSKESAVEISAFSSAAAPFSEVGGDTARRAWLCRRGRFGEAELPNHPKVVNQRPTTSPTSKIQQAITSPHMNPKPKMNPRRCAAP
jgi:hypothetical protein